jgi:hypothetical protein
MIMAIRLLNSVSEERQMTRRELCTYLLGAAAVVPAASMAQDRNDHRFYDRDHNDWHEWNEGEERAYHRYWEERHAEYRPWAKMKSEEQRAYWRWRHDHPDAVLWRH